MPRILHTGFDNLIKLQGYLADSDFEIIEDSGVTNSQLKAADLVLLGPHTRDLLKTVQTISRADGLISTIVLPGEINFDNIKQSLLFIPYMSKSASILHFNDNLKEELPKAAHLTRQRRKFAKITSSIESEKSSDKTPLVQLEHLGNFLDQAPMGAIILDATLKIVGMNQFSRQLFDLPPFKLANNLEEILDQNSVEAIRNNLLKRPVSRVLEIQSHNRYFDVHFAEITNESSENFEILLIWDVTEKKQEHQRIRNVLDSLPQMAWTTNAEGEVTYLTNGWYDFTGQTYNTATGNGWMNVVHDADRPDLQEKWQTSVNTGEFFETEARYRRHDGVYRWHLVRGTPMLTPGGKVSYWLGTCTDIHDQKIIQQSLSGQVEERTLELLKLNELLKKSNNDLKQFASVASHDLKEPVRKIKIYLDRFINATNAEAKKTFLDKIKDAATRMTDLIDGVMAYSEVSGGIHSEKVDLNSVLQSIQSDLEVILLEKEAKITVSNLPVIVGIRTQLSQLFSNLLLNSLKYTRRKPVITITSRTVDPMEIKDVDIKHDTPYYEIEVADNGIGFDKKYADEIFTMFRRLHNRDEFSGTGIGLALVRKIVANHSGFILVDSEPDKGSRFMIYLPVPSEVN